MNRKKVVLLSVVLVLAVFWVPWAQASQIKLDYNIGLDTYIVGGLGREVCSYTPVSGTLTEIPSGPCAFSQQEAIDLSFNLLTSTSALLPWPEKGPDLFTLNLPVISVTVTSWLDQTEPFPIKDAHWELTIQRTNGTYDYEGGPIVFQGGRDAGSGHPINCYIYSPGTVDVPITWTNYSPGFWSGWGAVNFDLEFILSTQGNAGDYPTAVPIPGAAPGWLRFNNVGNL